MRGGHVGILAVGTLVTAGMIDSPSHRSMNSQINTIDFRERPFIAIWEVTQACDLHAAADALYTVWIEFGSLSQDDEQRLLLITKQLKHLYEDHIQVEEQVVFPLAAQMLDSRAIAAVGREFRKRRE